MFKKLKQENQSSLQTNDDIDPDEALDCINLFQILFSANTADTDPGVSGVSKDQKFCEKFKNTHCQVDHPAKME